jgi:hypothetical protein
MKQNLQDIHVNCGESISILCENTNSISISKNPVMHSNTRNIMIKYHFLREKYTEKSIKLEYVWKKEKIADIFTKTITRETFECL